ncbi:MAG TPA: argininosuccinate synthase domain-containing protein [Vicinamibacterales bacterium]
MNKPVVLAFAGGLHASAAIPWLIDTMRVEVVTVTLDVGQGHELGALRARALDCGAIRAHVVDARDDFARDVLFPSLRTAPADEAPNAVTALAWPLIARKLVEIARIENAGAVAHGSTDLAFDAAIRAIDRSIDIIAPSRNWTMGADDLASYARARRLPVTTTSTTDCQIDQNLWGRMVAWTTQEAPAAIKTRVSRRLDEPATLDLHFEHGAPTSVNGVPMSPAELIECVALIGSQHGIGQTVVSAQGRQVLYDAPAATVLQVAASVAGQEAAADVCLKLADGAYTVLSPSDRHALLVNA